MALNCILNRLMYDYYYYYYKIFCYIVLWRDVLIPLPLCTPLCVCIEPFVALAL